MSPAKRSDLRPMPGPTRATRRQAPCRLDFLVLPQVSPFSILFPSFNMITAASQQAIISLF